MNYQIRENNGQKYLLLEAEGKLLQSEEDGLELIGLCMEHNTNLLLIDGDRLSDDFLRLKTGAAGAILQKFTLYRIKAAAVFDREKAQGKFKEFLRESNQGRSFRAYPSFEEAETWLLS